MIYMHFQPALYCEQYPILSYLLKLKSNYQAAENDVEVEIILLPNETSIVLGYEEGLKENQKYTYSVTAVNTIGNATTLLDGNLICEWILDTVDRFCY